MRVGGTVYYTLSDQIGSTSLTLNASGNKVADMRYKPWGEVRYQDGNIQTDRTYTGQRSYSDDFGLMFYNARWYDSAIGRFAQTDSIVPSGVQGYDRYAYVDNNPVNKNDPSGHCGFDTLGGELVASIMNCVKATQSAANAVSTGKKDLVALAVDFSGLKKVMNGTAEDLAQANSDAELLKSSNGTFQQRDQAMGKLLLYGLKTSAAIVGTGAVGLEAAGELKALIGATSEAKLISAAIEQANVAQGMSPQPGAAAALSVDGEIFTATSTKGKIPPTLNSDVQDTLDSIDPALRSPFHGRCAEVMCISNALDAGIDPEGGIITSVKVRYDGDPLHGEFFPPCSSCQQLIKKYNIEWTGD